jgi:peptide/nickel transport system permease protein
MGQLLLNNKFALMAFLFLLAFGLAAATSPAWVNADRVALNFDRRLFPPLTNSYVMGTDPLGRCLMSRIFLAARTSLALSLTVVCLSTVFGTALGMMAGYIGGMADTLIASAIDAALGFPAMLLALAAMYILGPSVPNMIAILTFARWMLFARVARAEAMRLRYMGWTEASRAIGANSFWVARKHVLPGMTTVLITLAAMEVAGTMLSESTLTFLGLGIQPPDVSLGLLVAQGKEYMNSAPWLVLMPGLVVFLLAMSFCTLAGWLAVAMDPAQRWRLR